MILSHLDLVATDGESERAGHQNTLSRVANGAGVTGPPLEYTGASNPLRPMRGSRQPAGHRRMKYLIFLGLPLFALDQLTKWLVRQNIPYGAEIPIIPGFFSLVHASNTGAAFSLFTGNNFFFVGLAVAALAVIIFLLVRDSRAPKSGAAAELTSPKYRSDCSPAASLEI